MMIIHLNVAVTTYDATITTPMLRGTMVHVIGITTMVENVHRGFNGISGSNEGDRVCQSYIYDANYCYNTWEGRIHIQIIEMVHSMMMIFLRCFIHGFVVDEPTFFELPKGQYAIRLNFIEDGGNKLRLGYIEEYRLNVLTLRWKMQRERPNHLMILNSISLFTIGENVMEILKSWSVQANQYRFTIEFDESEYYMKEIRNPSWFNTKVKILERQLVF